MSWYLVYVRPILEGLYFIAGAGLFATVIFGYKQLKLLKEDIQDKNRRAAVEKSIEYLNWFATEFIPLTIQYNKEAKERGIKSYNGPRNKDFVFDDNCKLASSYIQDHIRLCLECGGENILNQLEFFSAAMVSGLADEELAFNPLAKVYCQTIENLYVLLCFERRDDDSNLFSYTVSLYNHWDQRLHKMVLENKRSKLDLELSKIPDNRIKSIGS